jgi:hypothetical protein
MGSDPDEGLGKKPLKVWRVSLIAVIVGAAGAANEGHGDGLETPVLGRITHG